MEHREASVNIYWTTDYGQFKFLKGNRDLDELKVRRITRSVEGGLEFFKYCPIMVNEQMYIIDGQHRFYVCKQMHLNIYYVVVPNFSLRQIAEMNNNASRWKDVDFMNCYIDVGINDYKVLREFIDKYSLRVGIGASLLMNGASPTGGSGTDRDAFRDGLFKVAYLDEATELMEKCCQFNEFTSSWNSRSFIKAIQILTSSPDYDHQEMIEKLRMHNLAIEKRGTHKEYLTHLEELFNFRNSKRRRLY